MLIIIPLSEVKKVRQREVTSLVEWGFEPRQSDSRIYIQPLCYVALYPVRMGSVLCYPVGAILSFCFFCFVSISQSALLILSHLESLLPL